MTRTIIFLCLTVIISCQTDTGESSENHTNNSDRENQISYSSVIDTSLIAIIPLEQANWLSDADAPAVLTTNELLRLDTLLNRACADYNLNVKKEHDELMAFYSEDAELMGEEFTPRAFSEEHLIRDLSNYKRQYVPYKNEAGELVVQVFCNCIEFQLENWKTEILAIHDGGNCHFEAVINLTNKTCDQIMVNGYA